MSNYSADKLVKLILFRVGTAPDVETAVDVLCSIHPEISRERAKSLVHVEGMSAFPPSPQAYAMGRVFWLHDNAGWPDYSTNHRWIIHNKGYDPTTGGRTIIVRIYSAREKCPSCGAEIPVEATFCPACGRKVR